MPPATSQGVYGLVPWIICRDLGVRTLILIVAGHSMVIRYRTTSPDVRKVFNWVAERFPGIDGTATRARLCILVQNDFDAS